ncbi:hypothetical protein BKA62DRAFT_482074 [Auriculariales sp. MPI-PUGE-AT-0066]|nr:hypothetical protein BKA62DRAFT_482074 [Auriculariales sp. MPI-PUGE-AT-0066]
MTQHRSRRKFNIERGVQQQHGNIFGKHFDVLANRSRLIFRKLEQRLTNRTRRWPRLVRGNVLGSACLYCPVPPAPAPRGGRDDQFSEPSIYQPPSSAQVTYGSPGSRSGAAPASFDAWSSISPVPAEAAVVHPYRDDYPSTMPAPSTQPSSTQGKGSTIASAEVARLRRENDELRTRAQAPPQYSD